MPRSHNPIPLALKTVRQAMVDDDSARSQVNACVNRIRRAFNRAASKELISFTTYQ
jgi:hypothetical protein